MKQIEKLFWEKMDEKYGVELSAVVRRKQLYDYLDRYITIAKSANEDNQDAHQRVIWQYWNNEKKMPPIVKACLDSVKRNTTQEVILLSDQNRKQYIKLPEYIEEKHSIGIISHTHFSDVLRVALLASYGGTWMDATVYCTDIIPEKYVNCNLFLFQQGPCISYDFERIMRCSNWFITANRSNKLIRGLRDSLYNFWEHENDVGDYYLFHIFVSKLLDNYPNLKREWMDMPFADYQHPHYLSSVMKRNFTQEEWNKVKAISSIHKLTYKQRSVNSKSIYKKIINCEIG